MHLIGCVVTTICCFLAACTTFTQYNTNALRVKLNIVMSTNNFKNIHLGDIIRTRISESGIEKSRILKFHKITEEEMEAMLISKSLDAEIILKWSKLLEYDFFRLYSQHLILYSPAAKQDNGSPLPKSYKLPRFRKNIYTKEIIEFVVELIVKGNKTRLQVMEEYRIPKTTLYKWIEKYSFNKEV